MKFYQLVCLVSIVAGFLWISLIVVLMITDPKIPSVHPSLSLPDNTAVVQAEKESSDDPLAGLEEKQMWKHLGEGVYEFPWHSPATRSAPAPGAIARAAKPARPPEVQPTAMGVFQVFRQTA